MDERGNMQDVAMSGGVMQTLDTLAAGSALGAWAGASMCYIRREIAHGRGAGRLG